MMMIEKILLVLMFAAMMGGIGYAIIVGVRVRKVKEETQRKLVIVWMLQLIAIILLIHYIQGL